MQIEGESTKRYRLSYWGTFLGSYDTAQEALKAWESHNRIVRPVIDQKSEGRYIIRDGRKEITIADLRRTAPLSE